METASLAYTELTGREGTRPPVVLTVAAAPSSGEDRLRALLAEAASRVDLRGAAVGSSLAGQRRRLGLRFLALGQTGRASVRDHLDLVSLPLRSLAHPAARVA